MSYNGWKNHETWLVNLWFGDALLETASESRAPLTASDCREIVESYVDDAAHGLDPMLCDLINSALGAVDWWELADYASADREDGDEQAA